MNAVVHEHDAHTGFDLFIEKFDFFAKFATSVGINDAGVYSVENGFVFGPSVEVDLGFNICATLVESIGQKHTSGTEFV